MDFRITAPSWRDFDGYMATREEFLIARDLYLSNEEEQSHPYAAPSLAPDLHGLPPALVITAECDPMRDGGETYALRLREAGVLVTISRYDGMAHGFMGMRTVVPTQADQALAEATRAIRTAFTTAGSQ